MNYAIYLNQVGGDIQHIAESPSLEEITKLWEEWKTHDLFGWIDEDIILVHLSDNVDVDNELIGFYTILNSQREEVDEMDYVVYTEDGEHYTELEKFNSLEEARVYFNEQVAEAKKDVEDYFGILKIDWNEENTPFIALETLGGEGVPLDDEIEVWKPTHPGDPK
ncbi:hypothetical protein N9S87_00350 [Synechococcus sp. AH-779-G23]|nr:hypothetical protein [Synechococcus sp. AH-779-G23]MDA9638915.1 hypothetical protein [Synechococcus sp. AH-779-G23]